MECYKCKKKFVFHTIVKVYYFPSKADCLNGSPHMFGEWLKLWDANGELIEQRICRYCEHYERRIIKENQIEKMNLPDKKISKGMKLSEYFGVPENSFACFIEEETTKLLKAEEELYIHKKASLEKMKSPTTDEIKEIFDKE